MSFLPSYLDLLAENYGAGVKLLDFTSDTEGARNTINDWVSHQTEHKIPELLQQGDLDGNTALVLTNTVYFNASWDKAFETKDTSDGAFEKLDGSSVTVPLMHGSVGTGYAEGTDWKAVEIDYDGGEVSFVAVLPNEGSFASFEASLDQQKLSEITGAFTSEYSVDVTLPKLQIRTHLGLGDTLAQMGMPSAFGADADFSGMTGNRDLFIQKVIHEAFVNVNEAGTEAAAATAVVSGKLSIPQTATLALTRPFLFLIRDKATGAVIFLGQVVDPSAG
jgi:serine protease inhibitor